MIKYLLLLLISVPLFGQYYQRVDDSNLHIAAGDVRGHYKVNKFGYAPSGIQTTATDIWDLADASPTQQIWLAPADSAQIHKVVSSVSQDDSGGVGAWKVRLYGLTDWDSTETYEDIWLNGTDSVSTTNAYVIIHRMKVTSSGTGSDSVNIGNIKAIAANSLSVTAQISAGLGQTEMAIYGVPSSQTAYLTKWYGDIMKSTNAAFAQFRLMVNPYPQIHEHEFIVKSVRGAVTTGNSSNTWIHAPYMSFSGPCIIKVQAYASAADLDGSAGFDLILVDN